MGKLTWRGPQGKIILLVFGPLTLILVIPLIYVFTVVPGGSDGLWFLPPFFIILMVATTYLIYHEQRDVWHSIRTRIRIPIHHVLPVIYKALTDGRVPFTFVKPEPGGGRIRFGVKWDQVIDLNYGDLRLNLMAQQGGTFVFLGPVKKGNEGEVAKVKDLIGRALG